MKRTMALFAFSLLSVAMLWSGAIMAQDAPEEKADDKPNMLLTDIVVQTESTDAVNAMYNFKFDQADMGFRWLKLKYPDHPLPYFLLGLCEWWKIMPDPEQTRYDNRFFAYMDTTIMMAKRIHKKNKENPEAKFFLAGAYGFKARLHSDRKHWRLATVAAKNALEYMNEGKKLDSELSPEFLFGDAIYNYYAVWVAENYKFLRPVVALFPKGNKAEGIKQLTYVSRNAFYTRTEAQYFLMRIYANEENNPAMAFPIAEYLAQTFPDNAYFQRSYARMAYQQGNMGVTETVSRSIMEKIDKGMPGYEATSGRYASFYLGYIEKFIRRNNAEAKNYFLRCLKFSEENQALEAGYYLYSLLYLARIANEEKDIETAKKYYGIIEENADSKHEAYKEAKAFLKKHKKGWFWQKIILWRK